MRKYWLLFVAAFLAGQFLQATVVGQSSPSQILAYGQDSSTGAATFIGASSNALKVIGK